MNYRFFRDDRGPRLLAAPLAFLHRGSFAKSFTEASRGDGSLLTARPSRSRRAGFTILEMSIVLVIIAVFLGGGMVIFAASLKRQQADETNAKLAVIQKALLDYRRAFNRIPCPADIASYNIGDQYFGVEAGSHGDGSCVGTPSANDAYMISGVDCASAGNHCLYSGMVPTKTLKLPDDYAFDGWGRRILYAVDGEFTATDAFLSGTTVSSITYDTVTVLPYPPNPRFKIAYASGYYKTESAAYVLLSFGPNGHSAYGRLAGSRITAYSSRSEELENCDCDETGGASALNDVFYQLPYQPDSSNPQNTFDDILVYATRADLRSATE